MMKRFGLLGRTLGHSFSPQIHALLGDYPYELFPLEEAEIPGLLARTDLGGINVTIPYKKIVLPFCQTISDNARRIGCVNTILFQPGRRHGENTDYEGFATTLDSLALDLTDKQVIILGKGATAQTVETVCRDRGAKAILKVGRSDLPLAGASGPDSQVLINCTPVGMYPSNGASLVSLAEFADLAAVIDVVYNPHRTALLLEARALGIPYADGLPMLVGQAIRAAELFTGKTQLPEMNSRILQTIRRETENVVLIGMPGSGKSSVGRELATVMGRTLVDTDAEVVKQIGMPIADFFKTVGEAAFRAIEKQIIEKYGKESGLVIATGGGVIKDPENYAPLAQNGRIYYLERELEDLETQGRPLSAGGKNLSTLLAEREPLYRKFADVCLKNEDIQKTVALILEDFNENCCY